MEIRPRPQGKREFPLTGGDHVREVAPKHAAQRLLVLNRLSETRPFSLYFEVAILRLRCGESWKIPLFVHVGPPFDPSGEKINAEEVGIEKEWYEQFAGAAVFIADLADAEKLIRDRVAGTFNNLIRLFTLSAEFDSSSNAL
jgi:hypothetical protein